VSSIHASSGLTSFYRKGLIFFFIWILLEGALRKWVLPGLATPIFFVKYAVMAVLTLYFLGNREKVSRMSAPYMGVLLFYVFYCLLELFNMDVTDTAIVGFVGMAVHLGFLPLAVLLPKVITRNEQIDKIFTVLVWVALPIFVLGVIQYFSPTDSVINKYVNDDMGIAVVGSHARITTVFSYLAGHTSFLAFVMPFLFILVTTGFKSSQGRAIVIAVFLLGVLNLLMSGSRGSVAFFVIDVVLISLGIGMGFAGQKLNKSLFTVQLVVIGLLGMIVLTQTEQGSEALDSFVDRVQGNSDVGHRVEDAFDPFKFLDTSGLIGFGPGTTYEANQKYLTGRSRMPFFWEEESERVVIEIGLIGFLIVTMLRLWVLGFTVRTMFSASESSHKLILMVLAIIQLPSSLYLNLTIFNWMDNIIFWTTAGLTTAIYQIDLHEKQKAPSLSLASG
jgi:hypothetical protein